MKTFPPLHKATQEALNPCFEKLPLDVLRITSRAAYNAEVDPRVGEMMLLFKMDSVMSKLPEDFAFLKEMVPPEFELLGSLINSLFGHVAATAARVGDRSFFEQVSHCLMRSETEGIDAALNLAWLSSHLLAQEAAGGKAPQAAAVADAFSANSSKTALPAKLAIDACAKKALALPLAPGARGKKRKVEKRD